MKIYLRDPDHSRVELLAAGKLLSGTLKIMRRIGTRDHSLTNCKAALAETRALLSSPDSTALDTAA